MSVVLAVGLVVADGGGWRLVLDDFGVRWAASYLGLTDGSVIVQAAVIDGFWSGTLLGDAGGLFLLFAGAMLLTVFALLAVVAVSRGRRVVAALLAALMGAALAGWTGLSDARLGYTTVVLREARSQATGAGEIAVGITMGPVVALLVGAALLVAWWWAAAGRRARRRGVPVARPSWGASARLVALAVLVALPLPRLGLWVRDVAQSLFGTSAGGGCRRCRKPADRVPLPRGRAGPHGRRRHAPAARTSRRARRGHRHGRAVDTGRLGRRRAAAGRDLR